MAVWEKLKGSRKFWLAMLNFVSGALSLLINTYFPGDNGKVLLQGWALSQPVWVILIGAIAYEDGKALEAGTHPRQVERSDMFLGEVSDLIAELDRLDDEFLTGMDELDAERLAELTQAYLDAERDHGITPES